MRTRAPFLVLGLLLQIPAAARSEPGPAPAPTAPQSQEEAMGESYVEGSSYAGGARILLDAEGHLFSVQAGTGRMADFGDAPLFVVLATVSGPNAPWAFRFGKESPGLVLVVGEERYTPIEAQFAAQVVAPVSKETKPERSRRRDGGVTAVVDTTEHPLAILFRLPPSALRAPEKTLALRDFEIGGRRYNFDLRFAD